MRLKVFEQNAILSAVKCFDNNATVYLFGSRVDDTKKGGDIDLLVLSDRLTNGDKRVIKMKLYELLEEQKIDLLIAADDSDPFVKLALGTGIKL
jgi:predicted nucleotidyltransferase